MVAGQEVGGKAARAESYSAAGTAGRPGGTRRYPHTQPHLGPAGPRSEAPVKTTTRRPGTTLRLEALEDRLALSAVVSGGTLYVSGDNLANSVTVSSYVRYGGLYALKVTQDGVSSSFTYYQVYRNT